VDEILRQSGWTVLRFWEHDDSEQIIESVVQQLEAIDGVRRQVPATLTAGPVNPADSLGCKRGGFHN
jgi:hypothetical protein